jgi:murein hydrolase activator
MKCVYDYLMIPRIPAGAVFGLLAVLLAAPQAWGNKAAERDKELAAVKARIQAVQTRLKQDRGQQDELQQQLLDTETQIAQIQSRLRELRDEIAQQQQRVEDARTLQSRAAAEVERQRAILGSQLRAAHAVGRSGPVKLILNQEQVSGVGRVLSYYDYLNRSRTERILGIGTQIEMIRDIGTRLTTELQALSGLRQEQESQLAELAATRAERARTVARLAERIADAEAELERLEASERRLRDLIQQLSEALADMPVDVGDDRPVAQLQGKLPWPLRGKLLAKFGQAKGGGKFSWRGHWIEAPEGAPVKAVAAGRIAYVGWMQRYGLIVIVEHPGGYYTLYGHLQRVGRSEGEWIKGGQVLAQAGNTGGYDQTGVYFEIRKGREPVDPGGWLTR